MTGSCKYKGIRRKSFRLLAVRLANSSYPDAEKNMHHNPQPPTIRLADRESECEQRKKWVLLRKEEANPQMAKKKSEKFPHARDALAYVADRTQTQIWQSKSRKKNSVAPIVILVPPEGFQRRSTISWPVEFPD